MRLTVLGSGDAFGSGGRLQAACHVDAQGTTGSANGRFLVDCGSTALIGLRRAGLAPNDVGTIYISHLHGDHFGGLPFWMLDGQHVSRRTAPLLVAGPPGIEARFVAMSEAAYPGSTKTRRRFEMRFVEYEIGTAMTIGPAVVTAREVVHPSGAPSCALRIEADGQILAYSGDTEWSDALLPTSADADLFICECYAFDNPVPYHVDWQTLLARLPVISAKQLLLTHMGADMLAQCATLSHARVTFAHDDLVLDI